MKIEKGRKTPDGWLTTVIDPGLGIEQSLKRWKHQYPLVNPSIHPTHRRLLHDSITHGPTDLFFRVLTEHCASI